MDIRYEILAGQPVTEEIPAPPIENLVLEGGGARCIGQIGALEELEKKGILTKLKRVAGSSGGAILATMIAVGYSASEIGAFLDCVNVDKLKDTNYLRLFGKIPEVVSRPFPDKIGAGIEKAVPASVKKKHGIYKGDAYRKWLQVILTRKMLRVDVTFGDLHYLGFKDLSITAANLSLGGQMEVFSFENTPNVRILDALSASTCFPGFVPVEIDRGRGRHLYADGGMRSNFPMEIYDDVKYLPPGYRLTQQGANPATIGIKVDRKIEVEEVLFNAGKAQDISHTRDYMSRVVESIRTRENDETRRKHALRTIQVYDLGIDTLEFDIKPARRNALMDSGRQAARDWLDNHTCEAYEIKFFRNELAWLDDKIRSQQINGVLFSYSKWLKEVECDLSRATDEGQIKWLEGTRKILLYKINAMKDYMFEKMQAEVSIEPNIYRG